jgi:hypothetical protein
MEGNVDYHGTVESKEVENVRVLRERFSKELEMFRRSFNGMVEAVLDVHSKLISEGPRPAKDVVRDLLIILISAKFIRSSKAAMNLLLNGYFYEVYMLWRTMLEDMERLYCFFKDEKSVIDWLEGKFMAEKALFIAPELFDENSRRLYSLLSDHVHANVRSFGTLIKARDVEALSKDVSAMVSKIFYPTLPDPIESYGDIICSIALNLLFLSFIKRVYEKKMGNNIRDKIERLITEILYYVEKFLSSARF